MTDMFTLQEIAAALGRAKRTVSRRAATEAWPFEEQAAQGGKRRLYALATLPGDVQEAVLHAAALQAANALRSCPHYRAGTTIARRLNIEEAIDARVEHRNRERGAAAAAGLTGKAKARMDAKLEIITLLGAYAEVRNLGRMASLHAFVAAYNAGQIEVSADIAVAVQEHIGDKISAVSVRRWQRQLKEQGAAALAGAYGNRKGAGVLDADPEVNRAAIGLLADKPHISGALLHRALCTRFKAAAIPGVSSVRSWLANWKRENASDFMALTNPDAWKNRYLSAFGSMDEQIRAPNQLWMLDSTPADVLLDDGRYSILGVIDVFTRRVLLLVAKTSTAEAVGQLMRRAILEWGVPDAVKLDNGRDYTSVRFNRLLASLHIEPRFSMPFAGWEKAFIERAFKTFSHGLLEMLPGYVGHNVAEAQAIRARLSFSERLLEKNKVDEIRLTAAELQYFCDRWCDLYGQTAHKGLDGITPFDKAAASRSVVRRIDDVRALDLLLGEGVDRTVGKKGLRIEGRYYVAPELGTVIGEPVNVRMDDVDLGRAVVYHHETFLCIAECPEVTGISRQAVAAHARRRQLESTQAAKKMMRAAARKAGLRETIDDLLTESARTALPSPDMPNVVHMTPALEAAGEAARALDREARAEKAIRDFDAGLTPYPKIEPQTDEERAAIEFHFNEAYNWMQLEKLDEEAAAKARFTAALDLMLVPEDERNDLQRQQLKNYTPGAEFSGRMHLFEYFGPASLGLDPQKYAPLLPEGPERDRLIQSYPPGSLL